MRFNDTLQIHFKTENILEDMQIAPMLLLPFVENSFKHGSLKKGVLQVNIQLHCEGNHIVFKIENTNTNNETSEKGIGLENIKKRLDLLYKEAYQLKIDNTTELFKVHLELDITP